MIRVTVDIPDGTDIVAIFHAASDAGATGFTVAWSNAQAAADEADAPVRATVRGKVNPGSIRAALEELGPSSANKIAQHCGLKVTNGSVGKLLRKMADDGDIAATGTASSRLWTLNTDQ